ncbi:hydrolase 1, exosortase A system-associated [Altererythrobacter xixiisoli]|uniref:Hydrolase 1, exosortase A system-associated n=1 Tax=Croceibacterium xixiisoli TaxID=1476466 RepID=A0A6I4TZR0_9SPHN|nr:hydrolase 1, exosortase A system-associated [Croceibacterium xixiisoli]MXO99853.1 hydrolase 1, exosortase A system-associated [Croceibacterium xixiisoli]
MTRRHLSFVCAGSTLAATLDDASGTSGLLLVSGGNELRSGAFSGQARLAARVAEAGFPVMRFDRRGIGDSEGENAGFLGNGEDIAAALEAFRAECPDLTRVVGLGNCDAASALMLNGGGGCDALVLTNPWTFEEDAPADAMPPAAIRARYAEKLANPRELLRLVSGGVSVRKLASGVVRALRPPPPPTTLLQDMRNGIAAYPGAIRFLLAGRDRTAQAFRDGWGGADDRVTTRPDADHAFSDPADNDWLFRQIIAALA